MGAANWRMAAAILLVAGCGSPTGNNPLGTLLVGPGGGTLTVGNVEATFPPGAVSSPVQVNVFEERLADKGLGGTHRGLRFERADGATSLSAPAKFLVRGLGLGGGAADALSPALVGMAAHSLAAPAPAQRRTHRFEGEEQTVTVEVSDLGTLLVPISDAYDGVFVKFTPKTVARGIGEQFPVRVTVENARETNDPVFRFLNIFTKDGGKALSVGALGAASDAPITTDAPSSRPGPSSGTLQEKESWSYMPDSTFTCTAAGTANYRMTVPLRTPVLASAPPPDGKQANDQVIVATGVGTCGTGPQSCVDGRFGALLDRLRALIALLGPNANPLCVGLIESALADIAQYSTGMMSKAPDVLHTDTRARQAVRFLLTQALLQTLFLNTDFPCGMGTNGMTLCGGSTPTEGDHIVVAHVLAGDVPLADPSNLYTYAFVFDSDNVAGNNYQPSASYPKDFYKDSDRWYEATYSPGAGWQLVVTAGPSFGTRGNATASSAARLIVSGNTLLLVAPASEFATMYPKYRVSAFRHTGDFGAGGNWSANIEPPVDNGLSVWP